MARDQGVVIAKRSVSLTKSYPIIGVALSIVGVLFSSLSGFINGVTVSGTPPSAASSAAANTALGVPYLAVPFQALAAIVFSTSVLLLFVYDKNSGVLEYLLSLGMDQGDIYKQYLKASLILALSIVSFDVVFDAAAGFIGGTPEFSLGIAALVAAFALPSVAFGSVLMMSFSSLQKQRMGSNQPLGMAIGTLVIMPTYFLPLVEPTIAFKADLVLAGVVVALALVCYVLASRWISREKLLP